MEASALSSEPRSYGNYRRPQSAGLGKLGTLGTAALMAGLVAVIATLMFAGLVPALLVLLLSGLGIGALGVQDRHGRTLMHRAATRAGWARTRAAGSHIYRSGPLWRAHDTTFRLPGIAACTHVTEHEDAYARPFAIIHTPSQHHHAVVFTAEPDGGALVDEHQVDTWVAHWGAWLAQLGNEPDVEGVSTVIETAPDTGTRLRREVEQQAHPDAHPVARAMLAEVVDTYPAGSATIRAYATVTFTSRGRGRWLRLVAAGSVSGGVTRASPKRTVFRSSPANSGEGLRWRALVERADSDDREHGEGTRRWWTARTAGAGGRRRLRLVRVRSPRRTVSAIARRVLEDAPRARRCGSSWSTTTRPTRR